jgi:hypothetical protein
MVKLIKCDNCNGTRLVYEAEFKGAKISSQFQYVTLALGNTNETVKLEPVNCHKCDENGMIKKPKYSNKLVERLR